VARSVIVLDEAQALPIAYLRPCLALVRELVETYGCTVVLCTATQPSLEKRVDFTIGLENVRPIIPDAVGLYDAMRRVQVEFTGVMEDEAIAVGLSAEPRAMCIVNTRAHAAALYRRLGAAEGHFHLSALMCPTHRALRLWQIRRRLRHSLVCRVVSTQLVEAGVDLDFPMVYRAIAGFDAIAQAAGRCNREGRLSAGRVLVFRTPEPPPLGLLRQTAETAAELVERHHDPLHPDAVRAYFELHYWRQQDEMDRKQIMARLGEGFATLSFPFRQIAEDFRFIESPMLPVIVPWSRAGQRFVAELRKAYVPPPYADRRAQRYAVQIPRRWFYDLEAHGVIEWMHDRFAVLTNGDLYDANMGLQPRDPTYHPPESLISD
jgi:CRISPR-associated endonuclease/helicase Cas3